MKAVELFENVRTSGVFYHGTNNKFDVFDVKADKINRATNVTGAYFTPSASEADEYGNRVIQVEISPRRPFYYGRKNVITDAMAKKAKELLMRFTNYKEHWLETVIIPSFVEQGDFSKMSDISGDIKREILLAGGYDSYVDGRHVVILDPTPANVRIIKEL